MSSSTIHIIACSKEQMQLVSKFMQEINYTNQSNIIGITFNQPFVSILPDWKINVVESKVNDNAWFLRSPKLNWFDFTIGTP